MGDLEKEIRGEDKSERREGHDGVALRPYSQLVMDVAGGGATGESLKGVGFRREKEGIDPVLPVRFLKMEEAFRVWEESLCVYAGMGVPVTDMPKYEGLKVIEREIEWRKLGDFRTEMEGFGFGPESWARILYFKKELGKALNGMEQVACAFLAAGSFDASVMWDRAEGTLAVVWSDDSMEDFGISFGFGESGEVEAFAFITQAGSLPDEVQRGIVSSFLNHLMEYGEAESIRGIEIIEEAEGGELGEEGAETGLICGLVTSDWKVVELEQEKTQKEEIPVFEFVDDPKPDLGWVDPSKVDRFGVYGGKEDTVVTNGRIINLNLN
ncbi:MAG: hypothetical protein WCT01_00920 [Candidatus Shapirobacteria bacterium]